MMPTAISTSTEIDALLAAAAPVAIGISGGKDSQAAALATAAHLNRISHRGPRVLVHADLGVVEWSESLPVCERLAAHLGIELIVVRRAAGDLMDRWEARWASSIRRYANLETVTLVPPWSTPAMRFCTSELKTHVITAELKRRFPGRTFVNVTGIRRQESAARARGTIASADGSGRFWTWRPISDWTVDQVFESIAAAGLAPHEAYGKFGMSRVSCCFCIMSNAADLAAAAAVPETHEIYRRMVDLEIASSFGFQNSRWLGEVAPEILTEAQRHGLAASKLRAVTRIAAEARISKGMLYVKGWPTRMLTDAEAEVLSDVRKIVSAAIGFAADHLDVPAIHRRYSELMTAAPAKEGVH